jgi:hypothetical protein
MTQEFLPLHEKKISQEAADLMLLTLLLRTPIAGFSG